MASSSISSRGSFTSNSSITSSNSSHSVQNDEIIALFGVHGSTGREFVKLALDAGYTVQALVPTKSVVSLQHPSLTLVEGTLDDEEKLAQVVQGATFVVSMLGTDTLPTKKEYPPRHLLDFCKKLYPIMKESPTKLFLYQANSLAINDKGKAPVVSRILKETGNLLGVSPLNRDNDDVIQFIVEQSNEYFDYIVTRPGLLKQGPSKKKLAASKSLPGPVPVTHVDLAEFSLQALLNERLFNTCPYVVGDGF